VPGHAGPWPRATRRRAPAGLELESESGAGRETAPTSGARRSAGEREEGAGHGQIGPGARGWPRKEKGSGREGKGGVRAAGGLSAGWWAACGRGGREKKRPWAGPCGEGKEEEGREKGDGPARERKRERERKVKLQIRLLLNFEFKFRSK
jgi:hypothetical protein